MQKRKHPYPFCTILPKLVEIPRLAFARWLKRYGVCCTWGIIQKHYLAVKILKDRRGEGEEGTIRKYIALVTDMNMCPRLYTEMKDFEVDILSV